MNQMNAAGVYQWPFKRVVIISSNELCWLGAACAISMAETFMSNPDKHGSFSSIVVANHLDASQCILSAEDCKAPGIYPNLSHDAFESLCSNVPKREESLKRVFFTVDALQSKEVPRFVPDINNDLYVYISAWSESDCRSHEPLHSLASLRENGGLIAVLADDVTWRSTWNTVLLRLPSWKVFGCRLPSFAPPSHNLHLAQSLVRQCSKIKGVLECISLGVALGTVKLLPVGFRDPFRVVPLDIAVNTALVSVLLGSNGRLASSSSNRVIISVDFSVDYALVWGMFVEYVVDYYRRLGPRVSGAFPLPELLDPSPILRLNPCISDWINYGVTIMPFHCYYVRTEAQRRKLLMSYSPGTTAAKEICIFLQNIDMAVRLVAASAKARVSSTPTHGPNNAETPSSVCVQSDTWLYGNILHILTEDAFLRPLYPLISWKSVRWDIYIKSIAQAVVERVARDIFEQPFCLPSPVPLYHNDIVFHGARRAPSTRLFFRDKFPGAHWLSRSGLKSDGMRLTVSPGLTKELQLRILSRPEVAQVIEGVAKEEKLSIDVIRKRAMTILRTVGDNLNYVQLHTLGYMVRRVLFQLYDEVSLNDVAFERLYRVFNTPRVHVVLVPAHRSYVDFLIMTYLLVVMGFSPPHVCAGDDFMRMGPIAKLMRGSGAFFMRRSFRNDRLYYTVFREYVRQLVLQRKLMEFFIEGTRSRTGKTLPPKFGIIRFIIDTFCEAQEDVDDVLFFPLSLSYDELLEAKLYANEELGVPKPKESVGNLIRARSLLKTRHGSIHVHVGEPFSLRHFREHPFQCPEPFEPLERNDKPLPPNVSETMQRQVVTNLSWHIVHSIQENTVITPTALIATVFNVFEPTAAGMQFHEIYTQMEWLRRHIIKRNGILSRDCVNNSVVELARKGITHLRDFVNVSSDNNTISICQDAASFIAITIYTNQLIHIFMDDAVVAVAAQLYGNLDADGKTWHVKRSLLMEGCQQLRQLLSVEFQHCFPSCPLSFKSWFRHALSKLLDGDHSIEKDDESVMCVIQKDATQKNNNNNELDILSQDTIFIPATQLLRLLTFILSPFIGSLFVVSLALSAVSKEGCERLICREALLKACQKCALELYNTKQLAYPQSAGIDWLRSALEGIAGLSGFRLEGTGKESRYILSDSVDLNELLTRMRQLLQIARNTSLTSFSMSDESEQNAKSQILDEYQNHITVVNPLSKM